MARLLLAAALLLPALALAQDRGELNKITRVDVQDGQVLITGSRTPNFNTFTMTDPPRLVIDLSEAVFIGVPEVLSGQGAITGIKTASYGSAQAAIARVLVGFDHDVETDLQVQGNTLVVKVLRGAAPAPTPPVAAAPDAGPPQGAQTAQNTAQHEQVVAEAAQRAEEARRQQEEEARKAAARAEQETKAREQAQREAAEEKARRDAEAAKQAAAEEAKRRAEAEKAAAEQARQQAEAQRRAQEQAAKEAEARARAEEKARREAEAQAAREAEAEKKRAEAQAREAARRAEAERKAQLQAQQEAALQATRAAEEERRRQEQEAKEAARRARESELAEQKAHRQAVAEATKRAEQGPGVVTGRAKTLERVGFRPEGRGARVFIRTDAPARYELRERDERDLVVVLPHTRIGSANNARFLDTSFFDTPVQLVNPTEVGEDVHVEVKLKTVVPYQARQVGNELVLEFQAPGA